MKIAGLCWLLATAGFPGLLDMTLPEAQKTDFFTFFHLEEAGREAVGKQPVVIYKPSGPAFKKLVTVRVRLSPQGKIAELTIDMARPFINSRTQRVFANDMAKSVLSDGVGPTDRQTLNALVQEILSNKGMDSTLLTSQELPKTPDQGSPGYLTYLGKRYVHDQSLTACTLHIENLKVNDEDWLRIQLTRRTSRNN